MAYVAFEILELSHILCKPCAQALNKPFKTTSYKSIKDLKLKYKVT